MAESAFLARLRFNTNIKTEADESRSCPLTYGGAFVLQSSIVATFTALCYLYPSSLLTLTLISSTEYETIHAHQLQATATNPTTDPGFIPF